MANVTIQQINGGTAATTVTGTDTIEGQITGGGASKFFTLTTLMTWIKGLVNVWTKNQSVAYVSLTSGSTIASDASASNNFDLTLATNGTLSNPSNTSDGMNLIYFVTIDSTGGRTLSFGSNFIALDNCPAPLATANSINIICGTVHGGKIYYNISTKA